MELGFGIQKPVGHQYLEIGTDIEVVEAAPQLTLKNLTPAQLFPQAEDRKGATEVPAGLRQDDFWLRIL